MLRIKLEFWKSGWEGGLALRSGFNTGLTIMLSSRCFVDIKTLMPGATRLHLLLTRRKCSAPLHRGICLIFYWTGYGSMTISAVGWSRYKCECWPVSTRCGQQVWTLRSIKQCRWSKAFSLSQRKERLKSAWRYRFDCIKTLVWEPTSSSATWGLMKTNRVVMLLRWFSYRLTRWRQHRSMVRDSRSVSWDDVPQWSVKVQSSVREECMKTKNIFRLLVRLCFRDSVCCMPKYNRCVWGIDHQQKNLMLQDLPLLSELLRQAGHGPAISS